MTRFRSGRLTHQHIGISSFTEEKLVLDVIGHAQISGTLSVGVGKVKKKPLVIAAMDFSFIGGSMGSVVGEKISKAIDYCLEHKVPFMIISKLRKS